ncbi:MAG: 50S ribosomal protein L3 [Chloroflexota bacterium]
MTIEGIYGRKVGMTQLFEESGEAIPVTVIETTANVVIQVKTSKTDGYNAVQIGYGTRKKVTSPMKGHLRGFGQFAHLGEMKVDDIEKWEAGTKVGCEIFTPGELVDVSGATIGRGFAGVVKRHGFRGGPKTHGQSDRLRAPGSVGSGTSPGKVWKGMKMGGHMGTEQATVKSLEVVRADSDRGVLMVRGSVPGSNGKIVKIRRSPRNKAKK